MKNTKSFTLRISNNLDKALEKMSDKRQRSKAYLIRKAIENFIKDSKNSK